MGQTESYNDPDSKGLYVRTTRGNITLYITVVVSVSNRRTLSLCRKHLDTAAPFPDAPASRMLRLHLCTVGGSGGVPYRFDIQSMD